MAVMSRMSQASSGQRQPASSARSRGAARCLSATGVGLAVAWAARLPGEQFDFVAPTLPCRRSAGPAPLSTQQSLPAATPASTGSGSWAASGAVLAASLAVAGVRRTRRWTKDGRAGSIGRRSCHTEAACTGDCEAGTLYKKTQCLHPDKPIMFACADCPRRGGKAPMTAVADFNSADVSIAAFVGEQACSADCVTSKKTQCLHPDKPAMFACADCPRRGGKAPMDFVVDSDSADVAVAAFLGEQSCSADCVSSKKTQCLHPDKPAMFACADCPRRGGKAPVDSVADCDGADVAVAAFLGEQSCATTCINAKKTQCLHPDKPAMFACADCPRRGQKAPEDAAVDCDGVAVAAFLGEQSCPADCVNSKKTQCVHPDKPMMFACADCPRRGCKAPDAEVDSDGVAVAAFLGEQSCPADCVNSKKTQCLHPDKPMMFACADCPRRGGKVPMADGNTEVVVAAFVGEEAGSTQGSTSKKTQCLHPDKPAMFACADCPRRGAMCIAFQEAE